MRKVKTPFAIISAERFTLTKGENQKRHQELLNQLKRDGFKTKVVEGVYHGQTEKSILVLLESNFLSVDLGYLKNYGMIFDQESFLFVDADRKAELHFPATNKAEKLGNFVSVTKGIAIQCNNYTQDGQDFYICDLSGVA
jgi:hypothetical protein